MNCHICIYQKYLTNKIKEIRRTKLKYCYVVKSKNEEAIYNLAKLKLSSSDYQKSKELNKKLKSICSNFCNQSDKLKIEIENLSKK